MNYVKKMCILRQIKQGFSGDGKPLSGLIKIEQYGKNLAVEVSIINFAPLVSGEYFCLLSDGKGKTEMLSLRGKSIFNILSDLDISSGFCGIICYVKTEVVPIAYGINGNGAYDWRAILNKTMPPVFPSTKAGVDSALAEDLPRPQREFLNKNDEETFPKKKDFTQLTEEEFTLFTEENEPTKYEMNGQFTAAKPVFEEKKTADDVQPVTVKSNGEENAYDDEKLAKENYFEVKNERIESKEANENADTQGEVKDERTQERADAAEDDDATGVLRPFATSPDGYYLSIKRELDELFHRYPADATLAKTFQRSEWVRLRGSKEAPEFLVGALYEDGRVRYVCYALAATDKDNPPKEIQGVCSFVPISPLVGAAGFFVIFQSAATGECVKPERA